MYWNRLTFDNHVLTTPFLWDPASGKNSAAAAVPWDIFCGGHTFLPNGQLMVAGGAIAAFEGYDGAAVYDAVTNSWTVLPDMNKGRWYPTATALSTGDVLVTSGLDELSKNNTLPQVWQVNTSWSRSDIALFGYFRNWGLDSGCNDDLRRPLVWASSDVR